jgi:ECF sigma factor
MCHTPPLYSNNKLTPAEGFTIPEDHRKKYDILRVSVNEEEVAEALKVSPRTVRGDWSLARGWLYRELSRGGDGDD